MTKRLGARMVGAALVGVLAAATPSIAVANPDTWSPLATRECAPRTPDNFLDWVCTYKTVFEYDDVVGPDLPSRLYVYCPSGEPRCEGPQYLAFEFPDGTIDGWHYAVMSGWEFVDFTSPSGLAFKCASYDEPGFGTTQYQCAMWPGGVSFKGVFYWR